MKFSAHCCTTLLPTAAYLNCIAYVTYSVLLKDYFIWFANVPGLCLAVFYALMSITILARSNLSADHKRMNILIGVLIFGFFLFSILGFAAGLAFVGEDNERERAAAVIGNTGMCFSIMYYFAPLSTALTVIRTKNSASLYAPMLALNLANALLWMCYGLAIGEVAVFIPNILGTIVSGGCLILSFMIPKREKVPEEPKENVAFDEVSAPQSNPMFATAPEEPISEQQNVYARL